MLEVNAFFFTSVCCIFTDYSWQLRFDKKAKHLYQTDSFINWWRFVWLFTKSKTAFIYYSGMTQNLLIQKPSWSQMLLRFCLIWTGARGNTNCQNFECSWSRPKQNVFDKSIWQQGIFILELKVILAKEFFKKDNSTLSIKVCLIFMGQLRQMKRPI